jgi:hypothetical protein
MRYFAMPQPARSDTWRLTPWARTGLYTLFLFAGFYFTRAHLLTTHPYLNLDRYLAGTERLPFQRRILPMLLLRALDHLPLPARLLHSHSGIFAQPHQIYLFLLDLTSVATASLFTLALHRRASPRSRFHLLVFPILLFTLVWTYLIHTEANLYYPYDLLSLAFFTAGLYFIYTRRFLPLLLTLLIGTFNRETTLFLIPLFLLDATAPLTSLKKTLNSIPWLKTAALVLAWLAIKLYLNHLFRSNDRSEDILRLRYNLRYLPPNNWPQLLGGCGFLLPVVWFIRRRIPDPRIAAYILILPLWFLTMCCYGVLSETRIYGELCPLIAVACTLLLEAYADSADETA